MERETGVSRAIIVKGLHTWVGQVLTTYITNATHSAQSPVRTLEQFSLGVDTEWVRCQKFSTIFTYNPTDGEACACTKWSSHNAQRRGQYALVMLNHSSRPRLAHGQIRNVPSPYPPSFLLLPRKFEVPTAESRLQLLTTRARQIRRLCMKPKYGPPRAKVIKKCEWY